MLPLYVDEDGMARGLIEALRVNHVDVLTALEAGKAESSVPLCSRVITIKSSAPAAPANGNIGWIDATAIGPSGRAQSTLLVKFLEAVETGAQEVVAWGDGTPTREYVHVADAAQGIVDALEQYDGPEPVNIGSGQELRIREPAEQIAYAKTRPRSMVRPGKSAGWNGSPGETTRSA